MLNAAFILIFFLVPAAMLFLAHHQLWAQKIGVIVLCYLAGMLIGNSGLIPETVATVQTSMSEISVVLALPMLLFNLDIRQWSKMAGTAMLSMLLATVSVVTLATTLFFLFRGDGVESTSYLAAMSVGVYTGGTPNLAAIKAALDIPHSQYIVFHSLDTVVGGLYILMMLTIGIPFFRWFLGRGAVVGNNSSDTAQVLDDENYAPLFHLKNLPQVLAIVLLSTMVLVLSLGLSEAVKGLLPLASTSALTIIFITTLGMALSFSQRVRALALAYKTGMYLIYVFCFVVATLASLGEITQVSTTIAMFVFGTVAGSLLAHALLCKLFGVDSDTFMVTSVSAICSPPFVPLLVKALGNPGILLSGMTTGIIGYALGNYLGVSLALLLQG